jgi:hypothetical protein
VHINQTHLYIVGNGANAILGGAKRIIDRRHKNSADQI